MKAEVIGTRPALKDLKRLGTDAAVRVRGAVNRLAETGSGDVGRLTDVRPPEYRLRVGDWRVRFRMDENPPAVTVLHVSPRGEAYR